MVQIGIKDIRRWGNILILKRFSNTYEEIVKLSQSMYDVKVTPYGFLTEWLGKDCNINYKAMDSFVKCVDPMCFSLDMSPHSVDGEPSRRRFRNMWESLWRNFCQDVGWNDTAVCKIMSDVGLKIALVDSVDEDVASFYSQVISWGIVTKSEGALTDFGYDYKSVIQDMLVKDKCMEAIVCQVCGLEC